MIKWLFIILLIIPIVGADLIITPGTLSIESRVGEESIYSIVLNNTYDFEIVDVSFGGVDSYGISYDPINLNAEESKEIELRITSSESIHETLDVPVSFKYFVDISNTPKTVDIDITANGLSKRHIDIHNGDSIEFNNLDSISHTLFSSDFPGQEITISPNSSETITLNDIKTIIYYDVDFFDFTNYQGSINILNRTVKEKANNPLFDTFYRIEINSLLNPTNLSIVNSKGDYEIEYKKFKKGSIIIQNEGPEKAEVIEITSNSDWFVATENNFDIEVGDSNSVDYTITPLLVSTNDTDKEYNIEVSIKASNSQEYKLNISVYVPFKEITSGIGEDDLDLLNYLTNVFCPSHPQSFLCNQSLSSGNQSIVLEDQLFNITGSSRDLFEFRREISEIRDILTRNDNREKKTDEIISTEIPIIKEQLNITNKKANTTEKKRIYFSAFMWILAIVLVCIFAIRRIFAKMRKNNYNRALVEGQYRFNS